MKLLILLFGLCLVSISAQPQKEPTPRQLFTAGWVVGWGEGWQKVAGKTPRMPVAPNSPLKETTKFTYKEGYELGFIAGMVAARKL